MIFKEHPKRDSLITGIVLGISLAIVFFAVMPFIVHNRVVAGLLITLVVIVAGYPLAKYLFQKYNKKSSFEQKHRRKLK